METYKHIRGKEIVVLHGDNKSVAVPKPVFDQEFDPTYRDVRNVTVMEDTVRVEAEPFPSFDTSQPERVRDVVGYENRYRITEGGTVLSKLTQRIISTFFNEKGYEKFTAQIYNADGTVYNPHPRVHCVVAAAYIPNPEGKPEVNHIDGVKSNNHVSNLEWVTRMENHQHAIETGLRSGGKGKATRKEQ